MSKRGLISLCAVVIVIAALGVILYALIERSLGEHAQVEAAPTASSATTSSQASTTETPTPPPAAETSSPAPTTEGSSPASTAGATTTDSSYESATASVSVAKVEIGSGADTVTYYVADVQLTPGTILQAGLADGFEQRKVDYTTAIAEANDAVCAVNGDYCTARNTGVIIRNGVLYLDNPARTGLALYTDGTMKVYDEAEVSSEELLADGVWNTYSFGPVLLEDWLIPEGLDAAEVEDIGEQHTILGTQPRTGIGIIDTNHFVFVVVDGRDTGYSRGVTLSELAKIFEELGCSTAYNLDGGGSSAMYFMGELVNDPLGQGRERGISDILMVVE